MAETLSLADLEAFDPQAPRGGRERRFCCPFCGQGKSMSSDHRHLSLNTRTGAFVCHHGDCKASGKLTDFREERPKLSRHEFARQQLQRVTALPTPKAQPQPPDDEARAKADLLESQLQAARPLQGTPGADYLRGRGISVEVASAAGVLFSPQWRTSLKSQGGGAAVVFPILDRAGEIVAAQGREISGKGKFSLGPIGQGVFMAPARVAGKTYAPFDAEAPGVIVTEAPIDALSLAVAGCPAIAFCGTNAPDWFPKSCFRRRVFLAFDNDAFNENPHEAGDKAALKLAPKLESFGAMCQRLKPDCAKDWNEVLKVMGRDDLEDWLFHQMIK